MIPRENIPLKLHRNIFALRTKINHIRTNFCSSKDIETCYKCNGDMDNVHLFKCTRTNINNINYTHILNKIVLGPKNAIAFFNEN